MHLLTALMKLLVISLFLLLSKFTSGQAGKGESGDYAGPDVRRLHNLKGRTLLNQPFSDSIANKAGRIFLRITVDSSGNVIAVDGPARGSTTNDSLLLKRARLAAFNAKFSASAVDPIQTLTMSFTFHKNLLSYNSKAA